MMNYKKGMTQLGNEGKMMNRIVSVLKGKDISQKEKLDSHNKDEPKGCDKNVQVKMMLKVKEYVKKN